MVLRRRYAAKSLLEEEEEEYQDNDNQNLETASVIKDLTRRLDDLQACNDLMLKQGSGLQRALAELEMLDPPSPELTAKFKIVSERATLFRIASNAMINVSPNVIIFVKLNEARGIREPSSPCHSIRKSRFLFKILVLFPQNIQS